jgi:nitroreductase
VEKIIEMGIWAPNHRMTEPWKFVVLDQESAERIEIAKKIESFIIDNSINPNVSNVTKSAKRGGDEFRNCPVIIYVFSEEGKNSEETLENYSSTSISIQNMSLYAWSLKIGIGWSTGKPTKVKDLKNILGVPETSTTVGCLYMGYIENKSDIIKKSRTNYKNKTIWKKR